MADEVQASNANHVTIRNISWRDVFPFTRIFQTFRIAVHPSKLILGLVALLAIYFGGRVLDAVWPDKYSAVSNEPQEYVRYTPSAGADFDKQRTKLRDDNIEEYSQALVGLGVVKDSKQALNDAREGKYVSEVKQKIATKLGNDKQDADDARKVALEAAQKGEVAVRDDAILAAHQAHGKAYQRAFTRAHNDLQRLDSVLPQGIFEEFFKYQGAQANNVVQAVLNWNWLGGLQLGGGPVLDVDAPEAPESGSAAAAAARAARAGEAGVLQSVINFFAVGPAWLITGHPLYFILFMIWFLVVWAVFGGAIARIAAVHVARDEKISVRQALKFSFSKLLSFVFAPLIPLLIIVIVGVVVSAGGLLFYIPVIGPVVAGLFFILALVAGFVMALVALGTIGGFNLMYPTIAVEGSDSFDAISRSFSYVFARPWRMLFYTIVALAYGALTYLFVRFFIWLVLTLTHFFVSWWLGGSAGLYFPIIWPAPQFWNLPYDIDFALLGAASKLSAFLILFWVMLLVGLLGAFAISFYLSANTIIYYLLRREVDATELEDVYVEENEDEFDSAPLTAAAPAAPATSAPGGGVTGTAGSAPAGGDGGVRSYGEPSADAPPASDIPPAT